MKLHFFALDFYVRFFFEGSSVCLTNWEGRQSCVARYFHEPTTEEEIVNIINQAQSNHEKVRVVGAGKWCVFSVCVCLVCVCVMITLRLYATSKHILSNCWVNDYRFSHFNFRAFLERYHVDKRSSHFVG
jgi:hypothetical protein